MSTLFKTNKIPGLGDFDPPCITGERPRKSRVHEHESTTAFGSVCAKRPLPFNLMQRRQKKIRTPTGRLKACAFPVCMES